MRLLFITQKLHEQDSFGVLWVREFLRQGFTVTVVCLEGQESEKYEFPVLTLRKEQGYSRLSSVLRFERIIVSEKYDRVFIHMAPVWYALGFWWWLMCGIPTYLWYTHYKMQLGVRLFGFFGKRFFCATPQSLPQFASSPRKVVLGHGIDLAVWPKRQNICSDPRKLIAVHRLSRSKRLEIVIKALPLLDSAYTLDIYGIEAEREYVAELKMIVADLGLQFRVTFHGTVPMQELPEIYVRHRFILNLASETIDKTMLEAMTCGCFPVTTKANAEAIGIVPTPTPSPSAEGGGEQPAYSPEADTPEAVAEFLKTYADRSPLNAEEMYRIVSERHSLVGLVQKMSEYIRSGH